VNLGAGARLSGLALGCPPGLLRSGPGAMRIERVIAGHQRGSLNKGMKAPARPVREPF
jgi:hypothetical protein